MTDTTETPEQTSPDTTEGNEDNNVINPENPPEGTTVNDDAGKAGGTKTPDENAAIVSGDTTADGSVDISAYKDTLPDGVELTEADSKAFDNLKGVAAKHGMSADALKEMVGEYFSMQQAAIDSGTTAWTEQLQKWQTETKADPHIYGGSDEAYKANIALANSVVAKFATPGFKAMLGNATKDNPTGLGIGNNPDFIKSMLLIGQQFKEDTHVAGGVSSPENNAGSTYDAALAKRYASMLPQDKSGTA